jgi:serine/threonine protein kinase
MPEPSQDTARPIVVGACVAGKYRLVRRLAVGGMAEVWRARNDATAADVALKVLRRSDADVPFDARFRNEAKLSAMLSHRSIVRIFDLIEEQDGSLVLVMELLHGQSLAQYLKRKGTLPNKEAVAIAVPILSALAHAHDSGIVHRDVTPANIFLAIDPDGQVTPKLVDFGIAKLPSAGSQTLDGRVLGTPRYMSPEQIRGQEIDGRSDLFSIALVIYEMVSGVCPFAAETPAASLAAVLESPVDPDGRIEPRIWLEVHRALAKRAYERHKNAAELGDALRAAVGETEASLSALLRWDPPGRAAFELAEEQGPQSRPTRSVEGQSLEANARRRRQSAGWVALAVALCLVVLAGAMRKPAGASGASAVASSAGDITGAATAALDPTPTASPSPTLTPSPSSNATSTPAVPRFTRPRSRPVGPSPPRAKPVATTPGF